MSDSSLLWALIRNGSTQQGLDLMREVVMRDPSASHVMRLGLAYLWLGRYSAASEQFQIAIQNTARPSTELYGMAGVAKWCLGDHEAALREWNNGYVALDVNDQTRVRLPLLAFAAAILRMDFHNKRHDALILLETLERLGTVDWRAPLIRVVLGLKEETPPAPVSAEARELEVSLRKWSMQFYEAIRNFDLRLPSQLDRPDLRAEELKKSMRRLADSSQPEWAETSAFISLIRHEEYFIARHVASEQYETPQPPPPRIAPWHLLRQGNAKEGIAQILETYPKQPSVSNIMTLGVAYLWTADYEAAWNHFQHAIRNERWTHDSFFGMAGAAKWCMDEPDAAIKCWKSGLNCDYGDAGGASVGNRLLLFAASILRKDLIPLSESAALLREKIGDPRITSWPGPLLQFCLGKGNVDIGVEDTKSYFYSRLAIRKFYRCLLDVEDGILDWNEFRASMRELTDTSLPQFAEQRVFTSLIWKEEFFIARHEARSTA